MSNTLLYVPTIRPRMPIIISTIFLHSAWLKRPKLSGQSTQISITAGNAMPNIDKHMAPNSEMNRAKRGTDMAKRTENFKINVELSLFFNSLKDDDKRTEIKN